VANWLSTYRRRRIAGADVGNSFDDCVLRWTEELFGAGGRQQLSCLGCFNSCDDALHGPGSFWQHYEPHTRQELRAAVRNAVTFRRRAWISPDDRMDRCGALSMPGRR